MHLHNIRKWNDSLLTLRRLYSNTLALYLESGELDRVIYGRTTRSGIWSAIGTRIAHASIGGKRRRKVRVCTRIIRYHKAAAINVESEKCVLRRMASALCISTVSAHRLFRGIAFKLCWWNRCEGSKGRFEKWVDYLFSSWLDWEVLTIQGKKTKDFEVWRFVSERRVCIEIFLLEAPWIGIILFGWYKN